MWNQQGVAMKPEFYTQCKLVNGTTHSVAFIPSNFAIVGRNIIVNKKDEWTVEEVYEKVEKSAIKDQSHKSGNIWAATSGSIIVGHK
jgi:tRNA G37 N-methylase Trm5